jgi:hypothetical protein
LKEKYTLLQNFETIQHKFTMEKSLLVKVGTSSFDFRVVKVRYWIVQQGEYRHQPPREKKNPPSTLLVDQKLFLWRCMIQEDLHIQDDSNCYQSCILNEDLIGSFPMQFEWIQMDFLYKIYVSLIFLANQEKN